MNENLPRFTVRMSMKNFPSPFHNPSFPKPHTPSPVFCHFLITKPLTTQVPVDIRCQSETAERNLRLISSLISAGAARPFPKPVLLRNTFCILEQAVSGKCRAQAPKEVGLL
uniref:(northern house mosquito) hypothetical protein n=1 Tax=Culex pipiens TaxID=7175 RepID=A0A8D8L7H0_CULPI